MAKERNEYEYKHLCYCGEVSKHTLHIEHGLSGTKAKGMVTCPHCNGEVYMKIYLDVN